MHTKLSQGIVESRLRLDWANLLKEEISNMRAGTDLSYTEAKKVLRARLGLSKDTLNSHLDGSNTVDTANFLTACHLMGVTYIIYSNGQSEFISTDSIADAIDNQRRIKPIVKKGHR